MGNTAHGAWLDAQRPVQDGHDLRNHSDVTCLGERGRLVHYALHFGKYAGRLAAPDDGMMARTAVDCTLVCLSAANALGQRLDRVDARRGGEGPTALRGFADAAGRFAEGLLARDAKVSRHAMEAANLDLLRLCLDLADKARVDLPRAVDARRRELAGRAFFADDAAA